MSIGFIEKLFLDTNIILSGAYFPNSPARRLIRFKNNAEFVTSQRVKAECHRKISQHTKITQVRNSLIGTYGRFIKALGCTIIDDKGPSPWENPAENDRLIQDSAVAYGCDTLCTYNFKDFDNNKIRVLTPFETFGLLTPELNLDSFLHDIYLAEQGTAMFWGILNHPGALGRVGYSESGVSVTIDEDGSVRVQGPRVKIHKVGTPIQHGHVHITFRYNETTFDADQWIKNDGKWEQIKLCTASCQIGERLVLEVGQQVRGSVNIRALSACPIRIKDKNMPDCLDGNSVHVRFGSQNIEYVVRKAEADFKAQHPL